MEISIFFFIFYFPFAQEQRNGYDWLELIWEDEDQSVSLESLYQYKKHCAELPSVFLTTELLCVGLTILVRIKRPITNLLTGYSLSVSHLTFRIFFMTQVTEHVPDM